jgi:hypothetical protein
VIPDHADCRDLIWLTLPFQATISEEPPPPGSPWDTGLQCPHGVQFWVAPTDAQVAIWEREQAP